MYSVIPSENEVFVTLVTQAKSIFALQSHNVARPRRPLNIKRIIVPGASIGSRFSSEKFWTQPAWDIGMFKCRLCISTVVVAAI